MVLGPCAWQKKEEYQYLTACHGCSEHNLHQSGTTGQWLEKVLVTAKAHGRLLSNLLLQGYNCIELHQEHGNLKLENFLACLGPNERKDCGTCVLARAAGA
eukprot:scaffold416_cov329-Pavlova_lutheri.AAC.2